MNRFSRRRIVLGVLASIAAWRTAPADGVVTGVSGAARSSVIQLNGTAAVQSDVSQELVPETKNAPPAVARARLDRPTEGGDVSAAGQCLTVLATPNLGGVGNPNDAGLDLGAFSNDAITGWQVDGTVSEKRTVQLSSSDIGQNNIILGGVGRTRGHVLLSGIMLITALDAQKDLTGAQVRLGIQVTLRQENRPTTTPLEGEVLLSGGPGGNVIVDHATGVFQSALLPVVAFNDFVQDLPLVQAIVFTGMDFPYPYEVAIDQPFELELSVNVGIVTPPGGVGAAATFGVPPGEIASVLQRVKMADAGRALTKVITDHVDTTGQSYLGGASSWAALMPACGVMGVEAMAALAVTGSLTVVRRRRRRS